VFFKFFHIKNKIEEKIKPYPDPDPQIFHTVDPDPQLFKTLDPDPDRRQMDGDPKPCLKLTTIC